ncbi:MAG: patatin-like phospholipase family protein [Bacteroidota bacterium]
MTSENKKYKTGIVLSGGGARGFAHLGVLKALNESNIFPETISCVSAGSIVGVLYADGYSPDEILALFEHTDLYSMLRFYRPSLGMLKAIGLRKLLTKSLSVGRIEDLKMPVIISATDFGSATTEYFTNGSIVDAVMASSAIPLILKPYTINGKMYVDGGLMNNLPIEPLIGKCDEIIGVNVNPVKEMTQFNSFRNYADRVLHLAIRANVNNNIQKCDIYIEPEGLSNYQLFKISAAREIFEIGYKHAKLLLLKENQ